MSKEQEVYDTNKQYKKSFITPLARNPESEYYSYLSAQYQI